MEERFPAPDAVFIMDIDPILSIHRIAHSRGEEPNHFEDRANLARAREIFQGLSGDGIYHIEGANSRGAIHEQILDILLEQTFRTKWCAKPTEEGSVGY